MVEEFREVLKIDPMIEIRTIEDNDTDQDKKTFYVKGFIDLDMSSGINSKRFTFHMKDKEFDIKYIGKNPPSYGVMRLSQLHKLLCHETREE